MHIDAARAEAADDGEDVVRRPARHKGSQDQRYSFQCFFRSIFCFDLLLLFSAEPDSLAYLVNEVGPVSGGGRFRDMRLLERY